MSDRNWIDDVKAWILNEEPRLTIGQAVRDRSSALMRIKELDKELVRLKRGDFTPEEFQNLCHNRHEKEGCTAKDFFDGCAAYQKSLFGKSERDRLNTFLKSTADNYDCDTGAHGVHSPNCRSCEAKELLGLPNENSDQA